MSTNETSAARIPEHAERSEGGRRQAVLHLIRTTIFASSLFGLAGAVALVGGFLWFLWRIPKEEIVLTENAEGIVVLTGGAARIADAVELLATGRGRRLLITGVNPTIGLSEIARLVPRYRSLFTCCIDLDHSALNTTGNAVETRRWARERGFRSLVVVTSAYHMPRAMAELSHQLPDVTLIAFPVVSTKPRTESWGWTRSTTKLLVSEYLKFILAVVRMQVDTVLDVSWISNPRETAR